MTKTKKQLRAEAVERLKNCVAARFDAESIVIALTSGRHGQSDWSLECDKLIDLLTDGDSTISEVYSTAKRGMTNLEWLYEHDVYVNSFAKTMACLRGFSTDEFTANEWLRQEHSNDDSTPEKVVSGSEPCVTPESCRQYADQRKQGDDADCESCDSREQLEADVRDVCWGRNIYRFDSQKLYLKEHGLDVRENIVTTNYEGHVLVNVIMHLLDRQEAITKREWCDEQGFWNCAEDAVMLSAQVVQLTAERDELTAELDAAKQQISRFDAPKSVETSENPASKCEISDFDVWNVAYEIYCAGGYVDNGNEPNPPTDGIRELLDRQAAITAEETSNAWEEYRDATQREITELAADNDRLAKLLSKSLEEYSKLEAERDKLKELNGYHAAQYELASEDTDRLQAQVDELTNAGRKMSTELANMQDYITKVRAGRERYRSMCSEMATKIHDALMVMDEGMA